VAGCELILAPFFGDVIVGGAGSSVSMSTTCVADGND
jgi:hypothetical protein